jgi:hypothetical protein
MRIRLRSLPPPHELDGFSLEHYHVGQIYLLPMRLASLLILGGYADSADRRMRAEAADTGLPKPHKRR